MPRAQKVAETFNRSIERAKIKKALNSKSTEYAGLFIGDSAQDKGRGKLQSVVERANVDEFLCNALLADTKFEATKERFTMLSNDEINNMNEYGDIEESDNSIYNYQDLKIPRRPVWNDNTTPAELDRMEKDGFLKWRRELAAIEEESKLAITPFEKNLEIWKQLWRVIEKSDVVVQIIDARNPLLFRSRDVERYVKEVDKNKQVLLLINKADFLSAKMRDVWVDYFKKDGIDVVFFSAISQQNLDATSKRNELETHLRLAALHRLGMITSEDLLHYNSDTDEDMVDGDEDIDSEDDEDYDSEHEAEIAEEMENEKKYGLLPKIKASGFACLQDDEEVDISEPETEDEEDAVDKKELKESKKPVEKESESDQSSSEEEEVIKNIEKISMEESRIAENSEEEEEYIPSSAAKVLNREELLDYFYEIKKSMGRERICVGMVGYPNVGKSSTINALIEDHRVAVSSTPGKTRHFQTVKLNEEVMLCDCPGLVFPTFLSSKADLVCNGILPIDQLKNEDYLAPINICCSRITRAQFESTYTIRLPQHLKVTAHVLLETYSKWRGFVAGGGFVNEAKSTRHILKDLVNGKLIYCHPPPNLNEEDTKSFLNSLDKTRLCVEPQYNVLAQQVAVDEYADDLKPKSLSRNQLKGNTKAKARMRRAYKEGRQFVQHKGTAASQDSIEIHAAGVKKKGINNFRRKEYIPNNLDDEFN